MYPRSWINRTTQFNILSQTIFFKIPSKNTVFSTYKSFAINFMAKHKNLMSAYFMLGWEKFCYRKTLYRKSVVLPSKTSCGKVHSLHAFNTEFREPSCLGVTRAPGFTSLRLCLVFFYSFCLLLFEMEIIFNLTQHTWCGTQFLIPEFPEDCLYLCWLNCPSPPATNATDSLGTCPSSPSKFKLQTDKICVMRCTRF